MGPKKVSAKISGEKPKNIISLEANWEINTPPKKKLEEDARLKDLARQIKNTWTITKKNI